MAKLFPKLYDYLMSPLELLKFRSIRQTLMQKAKGQVLEIGSGTGLNFPYYTQVDKVIAIEPEALMREKSLKRVQKTRVNIEILPASAEQLPFPNNSFDTVVGTLVFCTIPYPEQALHEIRRVCKPEGQILLFEHVRLDHPFYGRLQDWLTPFWSKHCDGCHLNRNTLSMIEKAGFTITLVEHYYKGFFFGVEVINKKS